MLKETDKYIASSISERKKRELSKIMKTCNDSITLNDLKRCIPCIDDFFIKSPKDIITTLKSLRENAVKLLHNHEDFSLTCASVFQESFRLCKVTEYFNDINTFELNKILQNVSDILYAKMDNENNAFLLQVIEDNLNKALRITLRDFLLDIHDSIHTVRFTLPLINHFILEMEQYDVDYNFINAIIKSVNIIKKKFYDRLYEIFEKTAAKENRVKYITAYIKENNIEEKSYLHLISLCGGDSFEKILTDNFYYAF